MPLLSIIVPVHNVQGYLRACLDSIVDQSFTDFEIIAVDDASPDHCPTILDSYAGRDARIRVLHLDRNVGLGPARNAGLDHATGEYVWFVDSDDWLAPGALAAVAAQLHRLAPELLLLDHDRVSWLGEHTPSGGADLLRSGQDGGCVTTADRPAFLSLFTVAWNKVLRRDFLARTGIRFDVGWYEDLPFTFPVLASADRIATLGRVCYHYRTRRSGGITQTRSPRHFEVFAQWSLTFARLDALGPRVPPALRVAIFDRMVWHLLVVQSLDVRLPPHTRRAFFHQLSRHFHAYRPAGAVDPPGWPDRLRRTLIARDDYAAFRALRYLRIAASRLASSRVAMSRLGLSRIASSRVGLSRVGPRLVSTVHRPPIGRLAYPLLRRLPVDPNLAAYAAYWYRGVSCNPAAIYAKARQLAPQVRGVWLVDAAHTAEVPPGVSFVEAGSLRSYLLLARARYLVNNVNFPDFVHKRPGTVHLQTHHGTPVKVMGVEQSDPGLDRGRLVRRSDRWDFSLSANPHSTEVWARSYPCDYSTLEYGYPRNDRLALAGPAQVRAARDLLGLTGEETVVLYAPTHRDYQVGFQPLLDLDELAAALGPTHQLLVRAHYFYAGAPVLSVATRDVSGHPCIEDLMLAADVLITDYSSVMFDYAVLDRPIVIHAPDWDTYVRTRGVTFDLLAAPPGVVTTTTAGLADAFRTGAVWDDPATKARNNFRARFCALDDGGAAERVVRTVFAEALRG
jgi:CDP-glycerol glycerophosphotransferase